MPTKEEKEQLAQLFQTLDDLTRRLGQKDLIVSRQEITIIKMGDVLKSKEDQIHNLKKDVEKLNKKLEKAKGRDSKK